MKNDFFGIARSKKGSFSLLTDSAISLVALAIIVVLGVSILAGMRATQTANSTEYNLTTSAITSLSQFGSWFTILILVIIAVAILAFVMLLKRAGGNNGM